jgi:hypothetical protein
MDDVIANKLEQRLGRLHAKKCLGIEKDHEAQIFEESISSTFRTVFNSCADPKCAQIGRTLLARSEDAERIQVRGKLGAATA